MSVGRTTNSDLSHAFWQRRLGTKADVIGGSIALDGVLISVMNR
jgi:Repeat of unknown function (DUF346)